MKLIYYGIMYTQQQRCHKTVLVQTIIFKPFSCLHSDGHTLYPNSFRFQALEGMFSSRLGLHGYCLIPCNPLCPFQDPSEQFGFIGLLRIDTKYLSFPIERYNKDG
jgi:hypothetical protein